MTNQTIIVLTADETGYGKWGRGETRAEALKQARRQGGKPRERGFTVLTFGPDSTFEGVDQMGWVHWRGSEPASEQVAPR